MQVVSADGTQDVGTISKQWGGIVKEYLTDADNFGIKCAYVHAVKLMCYTIVVVMQVNEHIKFPHCMYSLGL